MPLGGETLTIQTAFMATNSFAGIIRDGGLGGGTGGTLDLSGGTLNLSDQNTYTGATILHNATLPLSGTGSIANSSGVEFNNSGNLDISQSTTGVTIRGLDDQADPYPSGDSVSLGASTLTINIASGTDTYSGVIQDGGIGGGTGGSIVVSGAGTLVLGNTNTYTGGTTINNGTTVDYAGYAALGTGGLTLNGGTVKNTSGSLLLVSGPVTLGSAGGIIDTNGQAASLTEAIRGTGGLTITGGGAADPYRPGCIYRANLNPKRQLNYWHRWFHHRHLRFNNCRRSSAESCQRRRREWCHDRLWNQS